MFCGICYYNIFRSVQVRFWTAGAGRHGGCLSSVTCFGLQSSLLACCKFVILLKCITENQTDLRNCSCLDRILRYSVFDHMTKCTSTSDD